MIGIKYEFVQWLPGGLKEGAKSFDFIWYVKNSTKAETNQENMMRLKTRRESWGDGGKLEGWKENRGRLCNLIKEGEKHYLQK